MTNIVTLTQPAPVARWLVLDIETGNPASCSIEAAINAWKPPANVKDPEKIEARRIEARAKIAEKGALLDAAPILCCAVKSEIGSVVFSGMGANARPVIDGWHVVAFDDERSMLQALAVYLDTMAGPETVLAGFNIQSFDLPKIRNAFIRHRLSLPACLKVNDQLQPMFDCMKKFRFFSAEHSDALYVSLDTVAVAFGIPRAKSVVSGADVPQMHEAGQIAEILTYNAIDVEVTAQIYLIMTA
jgi:hypothetical protein